MLIKYIWNVSSRQEQNRKVANLIKLFCMAAKLAVTLGSA